MTTNEILFYAGMVLGILFFIAAVVFFFVLKVPSSMAFLLKMNKRGFKAVRQKNMGESSLLDAQQAMSVTTSTRRTSTTVGQMKVDGPTEVLGQTGGPTQTQSRLTSERTKTSMLKKNTGKSTASLSVDGPTEVLGQAGKPTQSRFSSGKTATSTLKRNAGQKAPAPVVDGATEILGTTRKTVYTSASGKKMVEIDDEQTGVLIQEAVSKETYKKKNKKDNKKATESDVDSPTEILL